jgi:mycofactocin precursor peptide peptidase
VTLLADLAWPAIDRLAGRSILAVPLGSTEQHGPHLPFGTDTTIAVALAEGLAAHRSDVVVTPAMPFGSSGEHADFAGTLSIGGPALELVVVELVRSADAFAGVVLVSAHGGNQRALAAASARLHGEGRRTLVWSPSVPGGDAHAGRTETSLMLALRPGAVDLDAAAPGDVRPIQELMPTLERAGVAAVSSNGVLGDPAGAAAGEGDELLQALIANLVAAVDAWAA